MNILVLTQFYPPESCAASSRTSAVTSALRAAGHTMRVITAYPSFPNGVIERRYQPWRWSRERVEDSEIVRVPTYASPKLRARDRLLNWASVAVGATIAAAFTFERFDCVYVTCPPVTLALPAVVASWLKGCPLVVDVRDSYPDVAIRMGVWREDATLCRAVARIVSFLYRRASAISCVTDGVRQEVIARGAAPENTFVAPNGFDAVTPRLTAPYARTPEQFVVAFAGNMGVATGVEVILKAALQLRARSDIRFVLAGGGSDFENLRRCKAELTLDNVALLGPMDREDALAALRDADICVVPLRRGIADSLPTKLFDALYVGCPVLLSGGGEAARFVQVSQGGWCVPAEDPEALAQAIGEAASSRAECRQAGMRGQEYVLEFCSRSSGAGAVADRIATFRNCTTMANTSQTYL